MDRALDSLSTDFKPVAIELLARLVERGVHVLIVQTSRTLAEHQQNLANGTSATAHSKHLPRRLRGLIVGTADDDKADAMDLCPFEVWQIAGPDKLQWSEATPEGKAAFEAIRDIAESLGLRSGGRWVRPHDPGHVEWLFAGERYRDIPITSAAWLQHGVTNT